MRNLRVATLLLTFATTTGTFAAPTRSTAHRQMTENEGFIYWVAVYTAAGDAVDAYARFFDNDNYKRAMADEFERARYRDGVSTHIAARVSSLTFKERFIYLPSTEPHLAARLGEYSFSAKAFPIIQPNTGFSYFNYWVAGNGFDVNPFSLGHAVNAADFDWSLSMPESAANAFLKSHSNRVVAIRITYSILAEQNAVHSRRYYLTPFIHSVEVFANRKMTNLVTTLRRRPGTPGTPEAWSVQQQEMARLLIGTWRDENSVNTYATDGTQSTRWDDGRTGKSKWSFSRGIIRGETIERDGKRVVGAGGYTHRIVSLDKSSLIVVDSSGKTWHATRDYGIEGEAAVASGVSRNAASEADTSVPWPRPETQVQASYPEVARKARVKGRVIVRCSVSEQGDVVATEVVKALPFGLDAAAVAAVRAWKFRPALMNGKPIAATYDAVVDF